MNLKNIGENVKKIRIQKNMTQAQLAEKANISTVHMSHIETGSVAMSLDCLLNMCNALKVTPDDLLWGEYIVTEKKLQNTLDNYSKSMTTDENKFLIELARLIKELKINRKK